MIDLFGNTELTDCTDNNPFYSESMPDFPNRKRTPEKIEHDPKATPPASSKMPKEDNPAFFVYHILSTENRAYREV